MANSPSRSSGRPGRRVDVEPCLARDLREERRVIPAQLRELPSQAHLFPRARLSPSKLMRSRWIWLASSSVRLACTPRSGLPTGGGTPSSWLSAAFSSSSTLTLARFSPPVQVGERPANGRSHFRVADCSPNGPTARGAIRRRHKSSPWPTPFAWNYYPCGLAGQYHYWANRTLVFGSLFAPANRPESTKRRSALSGGKER